MPLYHHFRSLLEGNTTWCCPDTNTFPKHLLLGNLVTNEDSDGDPNENRTGFYPSPLLSHHENSLEHAKFLARKLDTLIQTFQAPTASTSAPIRATPSLFEDQCLEQRAIPYYYSVNLTHPIHQQWNYDLHRRGMDTSNYSYNASTYLAQGGAANPLGSQLGQFFALKDIWDKTLTPPSMQFPNSFNRIIFPFLSKLPILVQLLCQEE